jgi:hypothetical protein
MKKKNSLNCSGWFRTRHTNLKNYAFEFMSFTALNKPTVHEIMHLALSIFMHYGVYYSICFVAALIILLYITYHHRFP